MALPEYRALIMKDIQQELSFIWQWAKQLSLRGQMRLYSCRDSHHWEQAQQGFEVWFNADEIPRAIEKIELFYRESQLPNTPLFLDPMVYVKDGAIPTPVGLPIVYGTLISKPGASIPKHSIERLERAGMILSPVDFEPEPGQPTRQIFKYLGLLKTAQADFLTHPYHLDGSWMEILQAMQDVADIHSDSDIGRGYLLSELQYRLKNIGVVHHPSFKVMLAQAGITDLNSALKKSVNPSIVQDAGTCWNAYGRKQMLWDRYGIDANSLQRNLKLLEQSNQIISRALAEARLIFRANQKHFTQVPSPNLRMRFYTAPTQDHWRSKEQGTVVWFHPDDFIDDAFIERMHYFYNAGMLPNTPLFLDPVLYHHQDGNYLPLGTGVAWATVIATGQHHYTAAADQRYAETGVLTCPILRAGKTPSGVKVLAFLAEPYRWAEGSPASADAFAVPGCRELFEIGHVNADSFFPYYMLCGVEYLTTHGAFANSDIPLHANATDTEMDALITRYTVPLQRLQNADTCWKAYDQLHDLWVRFGIDMANLEHNVRFFNLCGRDLALFNMTGTAREDAQDGFEFFVPGWIPKSAITIIGATGGTGKSSLAHRLAVLASIDWRDDETPPKWLGSTLDKSVFKGLVVYFSGEDSPAIVNARAKMIDPAGRSSRLLVKYSNDFGNDKDGNAKNISHFLHDLAQLPEISLVVIDPARKYLLGDEDNSEVVSNFFEAIEMIATKQKCPVVVVHHLKKEAHPHDTRDIYDLLRGSQVFIDRPRVIIGMMRDGAHIVAGLSKNNIPPRLGMVEGERVFVRDPETLDLFWLPGPEGTRTYNITEEELLAMKREREKKASS